MKKTLLMGTALLAGVVGYAQNGRQVSPNLQKSVWKPKTQIDAEVFPSGNKNMQGPVSHAKSSAICTPTRFTSGPNVLTLIGNGSTQQNVLAYNKDLNTVLFTHRRSQDWAFSGKTSGAIQSTWKTIGGNWDSMIIYRDSAAVFAGRFPSGLNFNPTGNTNLSGSYMAAVGPTIYNGGFGGTFYATRQVSGSYHNVPANDVNAAAIGDPAIGNLDGYQDNADMQQVGNTIYVAGGITDPSITSTNASLYKGAALFKGTYSGGNFTWSVDSFIPGYALDTNKTSGNGYASGTALMPRVSFDPTGNIGYVVMFGRLATNYNNSADSMGAPIVYKTTNGGSTWAPVLLGYDWKGCHPECLRNCFNPKTGKTDKFSFMYGYYQNQHGLDVTTDANGVLHIVSTVNYPADDAKDSLIYGYEVGYWDYINTHPIIWDFMTDGTASYGWKTMLVDSIISSAVGDGATDSTRLKNPWEAGGGSGSFYGYGAHLTVSRSADGSKIFYGWGDSDPGNTGTVYNTAPDIMMKAYDVTNKKLTSLVNVTNGIGTCYYSFVSDYSYFDNTANKWITPFVYTVGRNTTTQGYDGNLPVDFYYGDCGGFVAGDFSNTAVINNCVNSIETVKNTFSNSVSNYPNPFNHATNIVVNLNESKAINVNVYDAIGNIVFTKNVHGNIGANTIVFDGSTLNAGVYYYTVTAGYEKVTKKMVIQK